MGETNFLQEKYADLPGSHPVDRAVKKVIREGERGPTTKEDRIDAYLNRIGKLIFNQEPAKSERALSLLRRMVTDEYIYPHKKKMAMGAAAVEEKAGHELGIEVHYDEGALRERGEIAVKDLEGSLDQWISYLSSPSEPYSLQFRYYVFRNILGLGRYDKGKGEFPKRSAGTSLLFPDIDRSALGYMQDMIKAGYDINFLNKFCEDQKQAGIPSQLLLTREKVQTFAKQPFAKQYAESIMQKGEITAELQTQTKGKWIKYPKDSNPTALWQSLQNKGTAWCTAGYATAEIQLNGGDFYVYYTLDGQGNPTIPRIAIRMQGGNIGEVRGVADKDQNLEGNMTDIAEVKMQELPGGERYKKATADMRLMTQVEKKTKMGQLLTAQELQFLYEINGTIEGFGYEKDLRIAQLRKQRNPEEDMPIVLSCERSQIARSLREIGPATKAFVGSLEPGIFAILAKYKIEHIYTSFPEGKIDLETIEIGGRSAQQLETELKKAKINISSYARDMLHSKDFKTLPDPQPLEIVKLKVQDLGFVSGYPTTDQIYKRAHDLGLELCPAEIGPHLRLKDLNQSINEWYYVGMKPITGSDGDPHVFSLAHDEDGLWLRIPWAHPDGKWPPVPLKTTSFAVFQTKYSPIQAQGA